MSLLTRFFRKKQIKSDHEEDSKKTSVLRVMQRTIEKLQNKKPKLYPNQFIYRYKSIDNVMKMSQDRLKYLKSNQYNASISDHDKEVIKTTLSSWDALKNDCIEIFALNDKNAIRKYKNLMSY